MGDSCGARRSSVITFSQQKRLSRETSPREEYKSYRRADENPHEGYIGVSKAAYLKRGLKRFNLCARVKVNTVSSFAPNKRAGGGNDDVTCDPQPFLIVVTETPPKSSCPPFFGFDTACERSIAPAQVPHTAFVLTNSRRGSINPDRRASSAMVVDSGEWGGVSQNCTWVVRDRTNLPRV